MIASKKYVDETLKANNLVANKSLGQNFLVESDIAEYIVNSANITSSTCVIEIGPGLGALTEFAVKQAGLVMAFEIDNNMVKILNETFKDDDNIVINNIDFLKVNIEEVYSDVLPQEKQHIINKLKQDKQARWNDKKEEIIENGLQYLMSLQKNV